MHWGWVRVVGLCCCLPWLVGRPPAGIHAAAPAGRAPQPYEVRLPWRIVGGPDGALWFTEQGANRIGRITPAGSVREYPIPTPQSGPEGITVGADGAIWFTEAFADRIGRLDPTTGAIREYALPHLGSRPAAIAAGPDGDLWFTGSYRQFNGRLDPRTGQVTEINSYFGRATDLAVAADGAAWITYNAITGVTISRVDVHGHFTWLRGTKRLHGTPMGITAGADSAMWFVDAGQPLVGRIRPDTGPVRQTIPITTYALHHAPWGIAQARDGTIWITESGYIGRVTPAGQVREFPLNPRLNTTPYGIAAGPDGAMWFTEPAADIIGRISTTGAITTFDLANAPGPPGALPAATVVPLGARYAALNPAPAGITTASNGVVWFTESYGNRIGRLTPTGTFTFYAIPTPRSGPHSIAVAPDGRVWFTEQFAGAVASLDPATGRIREYPVLTPGSYPMGIAIMPDGMVWFTEFYDAAIGRLDPHTGGVREFPLPAGGGPTALVSGPDGNLWFTEHDSGALGRITPSAQISEYPIPLPKGFPKLPLEPTDLTVGPGGALWFVETATNRIYRYTLNGHFSSFTVANSGFVGPVALAGATEGIWFTTTDGGVGRLDRNGHQTLFRPGRVPGLLQGTLDDYDLQAIAAGAHGMLWVAATKENAIVQVRPDGTQRRFGIPGRSGQPIAVLAQGTTLWIAQPAADALLRRTPDGQIRRYPLPTPHADPSSLAAARDGSIWFTEELVGKVGRIDRAGHLTEYPLSDPGSEPAAIAVTAPITGTGTPATSYTVWIAEALANRLDRLDPITGAIHGIPLPAGAGCPDALAPAGTGGLWLGMCTSDNIGRLTANGAITMFKGPHSSFYGRLRSAPNGTLWIAGEYLQGDLQSMLPNGTVVNHDLPDSYSTPTDVAVAPNGTVWFTEQDENRVGWLDPRTGQVQEYGVPTNLSGPTGITIDSAGTVWFVERDGNAVAQIDPQGRIQEYPLPLATQP